MNSAYIPPGEPANVAVPRNLGAARYARLSVENQDGQPVSVGEFRLFGEDRHTREMALGTDMSFVLQEEAAGNRYTNLDGEQASPEEILQQKGMNYVRLRLWVDPPAGYSDLESTLAMARRVKDAGMKLLLDIHYSDFWADPAKQYIPEAWKGQDLPTLARTVESYTRDVISAFSEQGTPVDMVQVGNEITNGMLWPVGNLYYKTEDGWYEAEGGWQAFGTLLKAGIKGVSEASHRGPRPRIIIHCDQGGDNATSRYFYDHIIDEGVEFDTIGLSYYFFWHGSVTNLRTNVNDLAVRYNKDIAVVETQYAWTLTNGDGLENFITTEDQLSDGYPASPEGQLSFVNDLLSILAQVPDGRGAGLFYWAPAWIPGVGWEPGAGAPNDNLTLFDFEGRSLPSVNIFQSPVFEDRRRSGTRKAGSTERR